MWRRFFSVGNNCLLPSEEFLHVVHSTTYSEHHPANNVIAQLGRPRNAAHYVLRAASSLQLRCDTLQHHALRLV